jgi:hypothetical protein
VSAYNTGADMWREYREQYGDAEARGICNRYLDLQVKNKDPVEDTFCRELFAAMQEDLQAQAPPIQPRTFEYGGYHFTPERKLRGREKDFDTAMRRASTDFGLGLSTYEWRKAEYSYEGFYAASTDKNCDLFRCVETGRLYMPALNELFTYREPRQRNRPPASRPSALSALEQAKVAAAVSRAAATKKHNDPEL